MRFFHFLTCNELGEAVPAVLGNDDELWRTHLSMFTSSPVLAGNLIFQVEYHGKLSCVNADTGKVLWDKKLGTAQVHASPLYGDGKLYVPQCPICSQKVSKAWLLSIYLDDFKRIKEIN